MLTSVTKCVLLRVCGCICHEGVVNLAAAYDLVFLHNAPQLFEQGYLVFAKHRVLYDM